MCDIYKKRLVKIMFEVALLPGAKLSIEQQIQKMDENGITFIYTSKDEAKKFLTDNTYFFKLWAFRKNYDKNSKDKYINLDFAYLKDFSTIDMRFRKLVLSMVLSIEHFLKVQLNNDISKNPNEDGYSIVTDFFENEDDEQHILNSFIYKQKSNYSGELIKKYLNNGRDSISGCPYWVLFEVLSFGDFIRFYAFYYKRNKIENKISEMLYPVKCIRNAAAHSNCVLNMLKKSLHNDFIVNKAVNSFVAINIKISQKSRMNCLAVPTLHDFAALCIVFNKVVTSEAVKLHTKKDCHDFIMRLERNKQYYEKNTEIKKFIEFSKKVLDIL